MILTHLFFALHALHLVSVLAFNIAPGISFAVAPLRSSNDVFLPVHRSPPERGSVFVPSSFGRTNRRRNDSFLRHVCRTLLNTNLASKDSDENHSDVDPNPSSSSSNTVEIEEVDVAIVGAGIGGLCAGAILNTIYGKKVGIYESHYLPGGCAHAFERSVKIDVDGKKETKTFTFDSGPTIVLGCSKEPYNPLQQVLRAVGVDSEVEWIPYDGWGMIEHPEDQSRNDQNVSDGVSGARKSPATKRWKLKVGPNHFEEGPLLTFSSSNNATAIREFETLRKITLPLVTGAATIPAMAMRPGSTALIPLLRYLPSLFQIIKNGVEASTGPFAPYMDGPIFKVSDPWLRNWLDALAFSLSGLPAARTSAAAMAYVLFDMHRENAALDYPKGGLGEVVKALVKGVEQNNFGANKGNVGSKVHLRRHVESIDTNDDGSKVVGLTVRCGGVSVDGSNDKRGKKIVVKAKDGVICNAPIWSLKKLIKNENALGILSGGESTETLFSATTEPNQSWTTPINADPSTGRGSSLLARGKEPSESTNFFTKCNSAEMTGSFLHLHVALNATNIDLDSLLPHYTVMDRGLEGDGLIIDGVIDGPCGELNMIALSNPCVLDPTLAPDKFIVMHAYGAGNEPYGIWKQFKNNTTNAFIDDSSSVSMTVKSSENAARKQYSSATYEALKNERAASLWRAIESVIPDARNRTVMALLGSPLTHERFLRRPYGTYGAAFEDCLKDGSTPIPNLVLCGDGVFPGIGIPAVALSGASAANGIVSVWDQWKCLDNLKKKGVID